MSSESTIQTVGPNKKYKNENTSEKHMQETKTFNQEEEKTLNRNQKTEYKIRSDSLV